jgi:hypothetical protein
MKSDLQLLFEWLFSLSACFVFLMLYGFSFVLVLHFIINVLQVPTLAVGPVLLILGLTVVACTDFIRHHSKSKRKNQSFLAPHLLNK